MLVAGPKIRRLPPEAESQSEADLLWRRVTLPVESFLGAVVSQLEDQVETFDPEVVPYARYALTNQGKQLRPALVALSAGAVGRMDDGVVRAAVIIEMIHLATLVHDDIMDEAAIRRSQPTLAANSGNQLSVLLGDCLFAHALKLAASYPTTEVCRAVSEATKRVCSGEILQTLRQRQKVCSRAEYYRILQMKTAELFGLSCDLGSWLGGANDVQRHALREFGLTLGTAYQVYDDCVDLFGEEEVAGKSLGTDLASGKVTLPILVALERASAADAAELRHLIDGSDNRHGKARVRELLEEYGALDGCRGEVRRLLMAGRKELEILAPSDHRDALIAVSSFLEKQTDDLGV